ncbi:hypothetical protein MRB53_041284 [Persea americana]|nr:hypothetical protein MRB53_041284 [Persea americana]
MWERRGRLSNTTALSVSRRVAVAHAGTTMATGRASTVVAASHSTPRMTIQSTSTGLRGDDDDDDDEYHYGEQPHSQRELGRWTMGDVHHASEPK